MRSISNAILSLCLLAGLFCLPACGDQGGSTESNEQSRAGSPENKDQAGPETGDPAPATDMLTITGDNVNVRSQAGTEGKVVFQLNNNEKVPVTGESTFFETVGDKTDFWYEVQKDGRSGWVFGAFTDRKLSVRGRKNDMVFSMAELGDYFHLVFVWPGEGEKGRGYGWKCPRYGMEPYGEWDFGYGESHHDLSGYELYLENEEGLGTNPEFENKLFEVDWRVQMTDAWEGEGSMETVKMEVPVISGLTLKK